MHQEGHCHVRPIAEVPLQRHTPPDRMNNRESTNDGSLATPVIGLYLALVATKKHYTWGPRHIRHSTPRHGCVSEVAIRMEGSDAHILEPPLNSQATTEGRHRLVASPTQRLLLLS